MELHTQVLPFQTPPYGFVRSRSAYSGPDPVRVKEQLLHLQSLWKTLGPKKFMYRHCWIQPKPPEKGERRSPPTNSKLWNRNLIPFLENRIQTDIEARLGKRNICVKPRQGGYTTYFMIRRLFLPCILNPGENGLLIAQKGQAVTDYFRILKRCYNTFGVVDPFDKNKNTFAKELHQHLLHTTYSNRRELVFDQIDVSIHCESAEVEESGQGYTPTHVLADEVARWEHDPEATLANLKEGIPQSGTLDLISTANGWGGYFFEECMRSRDKTRIYQEYVYHFHPWWYHDEYYDDIPADESSLTKDEFRLMMTYNLNPQQIAWRRRKKEELRTDFDEKYPENDVDCFLLTGQQFFDKDIIRERRLELTTYKPKWEGEKLTIFKNEKPHHEYIIGADVASGLDATEGKGDLDYSAAVVIDKATGEECASYHAHIIPEEFAWELVNLARRYNNALLAIERNNEGGAVILTCEVACMYGNLYKHREWWKKDWKRGKNVQHGSGSGGATGQFREIVGFPTTQKTRPIALNRLRHFISESPDLIYDIHAIEECATFVRDWKKKGIPAASPGCHDDRVLCRAIAYYVRNVVLGYLSPEQLPRSEKYGATPQEFAVDEQLSEDDTSDA